MDYLKLYQYATKKPFRYMDKNTDTEWDYEIVGNTLKTRFEGSGSTVDWVLNFFCPKVPYRGMEEKFRVHAGFLLKYKTVREEIHELIRENDIERVEFYGFSQGAAMCVLGHEDVTTNFPKVFVQSIVFGCPRVVTIGAPSKRWCNFLRVENGNDIVTKLPFRWMRYKPVGEAVHIGKDRKWYKVSVKEHLHYKDVLKAA